VKFLPALFLAFLLSPAASSWGQKISGRVEVHFIDVGQADAILVVSPEKECVMLLDSGNGRYPRSSKNFRRYMLEKVPKGYEINLVVASLPHADHIGNMRWVLQNYRVRTYIDNGQEYESRLYQSLMDEVHKQAKQNGLRYFVHTVTPPRDQDFCEAENLDTVLLFPREGYDPDFCQTNPNNCSVIVKLLYNKTSFLFPGDAGKEQEELLLKDREVRERLPSDVLKAGDHGSDTSSSKEFLQAVSPKWVVVSSGRKGVGTNVQYKHPRLSAVTAFQELVGPSGANKRAVDVFDKARSKWIRKSISGNLFLTARDGTVALSSDGREIRKD